MVNVTRPNQIVPTAALDPDLQMLVSALPLAPPLAKPRPGQPPRQQVAYTPEVAGQVLERIVEGDTWEDIEKIDGLPTYGAWLRWQVAVPGLAEMNRRAKKIAAQALFEKVLRIAASLQAGGLTVADSGSLAKAAEIYKWAAAKLNPFEFAERASPTPAVAVQINTTLNLDPNSAAPEAQRSVYTLTARVPVIDVEPEESPLPHLKPSSVGKRRGKK